MPAREIDYESLRFLIERSEASPFKKRRELERLRKGFRQGKGRVGRYRGLELPANEDADHKWLRCEARFMLGDYSDWSGWEYRDPWATSNWFTNSSNLPVWKAQKVKKLFVQGEQGLGDEVLFAQSVFFVKEMGLADEIIFETQPRLVSIFNRCLPVTAVPAELVPHPSGEGEMRVKKEMEGDAWVTLGELCRLYLRNETFQRKPYLFAEQTGRFERYRGRTGISWRGRQGTEKRMISAYPDGLSLQYGMAWDEGVESPEGLDLKNDLEGILELLSVLGKLVTVSTSVAHFASAMGVPTEVIVAPRSTSQNANLVPWKWQAKNLPNQTWWYGKTTKTFSSWNDYVRYMPRGFGRGA